MSVSNAAPTVAIDMKSRIILTDDVTYREEAANLNSFAFRSIMRPSKNGYFEFSGYSYYDYSDTATYVIDRDHYATSRMALNYDHLFKNWTFQTGASGVIKLSDDNVTPVKYMYGGLNEKREGYLKLGAKIPNQILKVNTYYMNTIYETESDTLNIKSLYNVVEASTPELIDGLRVGIDAQLKPVFSNIIGEDTVTLDYYRAGAFVSKENLGFKNFDLKIGFNGDYGSGVVDDKWITSSLYYTKKISKVNLFSNFFNEYSTTDKMILRQMVEFGIYRNILNENLNTGGYAATVRLTDKRGSLNLLTRIRAKFFPLQSLYIQPMIYLYGSAISKEVINRESIEVGYYLLKGFKVYLDPQFELRKLHSVDSTRTNFYLNSGLSFNF